MRSVAYGVTSRDEAQRAVRELAAKGPDFVKIWVDDRNGTVTKLSPPLYRAIIDEAHRHGLRVMAHVYYLADARDLVEAGVDGFLHLVRDQEMDEALVKRMKEKRVFVTPNLGTSEAGTYTGPPGWLSDPSLAETAAPSLLRKVADFYTARQAGRAAPPSAAEASSRGAAPQSRQTRRGWGHDRARERHRHREHVLRLRGASRARADGGRRHDANGGDRRGDPDTSRAPASRSAWHYRQREGRRFHRARGQPARGHRQCTEDRGGVSARSEIDRARMRAAW